MNRAERRRQEKQAQKNAGGSAEMLQKALADFRVEKFAACARKSGTVLATQPDNADANYLFGMSAYRQEDFETAERHLKIAIEHLPGQAELYNNLGLVLRDLGRNEESLETFEKALACDPANAETHRYLGQVLAMLGRSDDAIENFEGSLALDPDNTASLTSYGNVLIGLKKFDRAIACLRRVMELEPAFPGGYVNLANALKEQGELAAAIEIYRLAVDLDPGFVVALMNLTLAQNLLGRLDDAFESCLKALQLDPNAWQAWTDLINILTIHMGGTGEKDIAGCIAELPDGFCGNPETAMNCALLELNLAIEYGSPTAQEAFDKAMAALPSRSSQFVGNGKDGHDIDAGALDPVGLIHFGRSGTGLMHSLIDNHPEVSSLPSIYLKGYFEPGVWQRLCADGFEKLPERFVDMFKVMFDAADPTPVPGLLNEDTSKLGLKEGMTTVGDGHDRKLTVDRDAFCAEAHRLIREFGGVDAGGFLRIVFRAYEVALGNDKKDPLPFYHIHNPGWQARVDFLRYFPGARLMMMVREPVQSCESWIREDFKAADYGAIAGKISAMLYDIDRPEYARIDTAGVRLEDLKTRPEETLGALCKWLGIAPSPTLYEMTAQGEMWWGDPTSADFEQDKPMPPFDNASIVRPVGTIFSDRDQLVLSTLYYPFRVRFNYTEEDADGFARDLQVIRPMLDDLLDFEKDIAQRLGKDAETFKQRGDYRLSRSRLTNRWNLLDELGDYPSMLEPLSLYR